MRQVGRANEQSMYSLMSMVPPPPRIGLAGKNLLRTNTLTFIVLVEEMKKIMFSNTCSKVLKL